MNVAVALVATALLTSVAAANVSPAQAAAFQKKLEQILLNSGRASDTPRQTAISEGEVNSYLRFSAGEQLPVGVTDPSVVIAGQGRLQGRAIVDLDVIRRKRSGGGWFDPMSYLTGQLPVTASGLLETHEGRGKFTLETAAVSGVPIPKPFLQELVTFYTRSADLPTGINIDEPFELPAQIQRIDVQQQGRALVIQ